MDFFARRAHTMKMSNFSTIEGENSIQPITGFNVKDKELYKLQQVCEAPIRLQYTQGNKSSEELIDEFFNYIDNWKEDLSDMDAWVEEVDEFIQNVLKKKSKNRKRSSKKTKLSILHPERDSRAFLTNDKKEDISISIKYEGGVLNYGGSLSERLV